MCFDTKQRADAATTMQIETALFQQDYRIIHVAAHGLFQPDDPTRTGVVVGPDDFLTAQVFGQLNVIPDLVFLNCCHLAGVAIGTDTGAIEFTRKNLNRLGASLARQLIDSGVRAVVVAGWAVDDAAAESFAREFYAEMLNGRTFGRAVYAARQAACTASPHHSTWGAYQCYGDGGYRLPRDTGNWTADRKLRAPITLGEAMRWVAAIVNRIESVGIEAERTTTQGDGTQRSDREIAIGELTLIEETARARGWAGGSTGRLCEQLGYAWAAVGDHERAIAQLDQALHAKDGSMTLSGIEKVANLKDRLAAHLTRHPDADDDDRSRAAALGDEAMHTIELLEQLSQSGERSALRAGHHKRRATVMTGDDRITALGEAAAAYLRSFEQDPKDYTLFNYIQLEEIRSRVAGEPSAAARYHDELDRRLADQHDGRSGDYWQAVAHADGVLTSALVRDAVTRRAEELIDAYSTAFDSRSTASQRASTLDHLVDLADLHPDPDQAAALTRIRERLIADNAPPPTSPAD